MGAGAGLRGERRGPLSPGSVCCGAVDNTRLVADPRSLERMYVVNYRSAPLSLEKRRPVFWNQLESRREGRAGVKVGPARLGARGALGVIWQLTGLAR